MGLLDQGVALGLLGSVGKKSDPGGLDAVHVPHEASALVSELDQHGRRAVDVGARVHKSGEAALLCGKDRGESRTDPFAGLCQEHHGTHEKGSGASCVHEARAAFVVAQKRERLHQRGFPLSLDRLYRMVEIVDFLGSIYDADPVFRSAVCGDLLLDHVPVSDKCHADSGEISQCLAGALDDGCRSLVASLGVNHDCRSLRIHNHSKPIM